MEHHEQHGPVTVRPEYFPSAANAAFWTGMTSIFCVIVTIFGPVGYVLALLTFPLALLGFVQARRQDRSFRIAVPGLVCAITTIVVWLLARDEWPHVIGGYQSWPSWIIGH